MDNIVVRRAMPSDYVAVAEVSAKTFYETWRPVNTEEDMQMYMAEAFNEPQIKKELDAATNVFLLAEVDGRIVGYTKLRLDSIPAGNYLADWEHTLQREFADSSTLEMERLYVLQEYHGKKAGKQLMDESIRIAKQQNADWLWLGVATENFKAQNFYKSYGFTQFGKKAFKLGNAVDLHTF